MSDETKKIDIKYVPQDSVYTIKLVESPDNNLWRALGISEERYDEIESFFQQAVSDAPEDSATADILEVVTSQVKTASELFCVGVIYAEWLRQLSRAHLVKSLEKKFGKGSIEILDAIPAEAEVVSSILSEGGMT